MVSPDIGFSLYGEHFLVVEIAWLKFDRSAMGRARAGMLPRVPRALELLHVGDALFRDDPLERIQPMVIIGLAGVRIAGGLCLLDLIAERCRPFVPGEQSALMQ